MLKTFLYITNSLVNAHSRSFTPIHGLIHADSRSFTPIKAHSRSHSRRFTLIHANSRPFTPIHALSRSLTPIHAPSPWIPRLQKKVTPKRRSRLSSQGVVIKTVDKTGRVRVPAPQSYLPFLSRPYDRDLAQAWRAEAEGNAGVSTNVRPSTLQVPHIFQGRRVLLPG